MVSSPLLSCWWVTSCGQSCPIPCSSSCQRLSAARMSEQRGCIINSIKKLAERSVSSLSQLKEGQEFRVQEQGSWKPAVIVRIANTERSYCAFCWWTRISTKQTPPPGHKRTDSVQHQSTVHHTMTLCTHLTTLMNCPNPILTEPDMDARVILDLLVYKGVGGIAALFKKQTNKQQIKLFNTVYMFLYIWQPMNTFKN